MRPDAECPCCGGAVPVPEVPAGEKRTVRCGSCGASLDAVRPADGAETLFQPQLLSGERPSGKETVAVEEGRATVRVGSGTELLESEEPEDEPEIETVLHAVLVVQGAVPGQERLRLGEGRKVVGREGADLVVEDRSISSRHFEVEGRHGEFFIRDLASSNGTFVNGDEIRAQQLAPGDTIRAGETTFIFKTYEAIAL